MRPIRVLFMAVLALILPVWAGMATLVVAERVREWGAGRFWSFASDAEMFLVPEGFEGGVTLVFGSAKGDTARREGVARVYDFRTRRVVRLRDAAPQGRRRYPDFVAVDSQGRRRHLARGWRCEEGPTAGGVYLCPPDTILGDQSTVVAETWVVTRDPRRIVAHRLAGDTIVEIGRAMRAADYRPVELSWMSKPRRP